MNPEPRTLSELQFTTRHVKVCVWPWCDTELVDDVRRIGPLCLLHCREIHNAMITLEMQTAAKADLTPERRALVSEIEWQIDEVHRSRRRKVEARQIQPGWVYYVAVGKRIKVGYATDVRRRIRAYPPGSKLLAVHPGTPALERQMHGRLAIARVAGREWYDPTPKVMAHIDRVIAEFGAPPDSFSYEFREPGRPPSRQVTRVKGGAMQTAG